MTELPEDWDEMTEPEKRSAYLDAEARADALDVERLKTIHHPVTNPMCAGDTVTDVSTSDDTPAWLGDLRAMLGIEDERVLLDMLERDPVLRQQVYDAVQAIDARVRAEVAAQVRNLQPRGMSTPASVGYGEAIGDVLALLEGAR